MLHTLADNLEIVWGALLAAAIVVLLTPAVGGMARLLGVVDRPEGRRLNRRTVPRLGGLALFFGIFVPALAFLDLSGETRGLLLGAAVATTVGAVDDFRGLNWWEKLGGQVAAAAIPVGFGIWVHRFTFPIVGVHTLPKWLGMPLSVLWRSMTRKQRPTCISPRPNASSIGTLTERKRNLIAQCKLIRIRHHPTTLSPPCTPLEVIATKRWSTCSAHRRSIQPRSG